MTNLQPLKALKSDDGTVKYLWRLADGQTVESVYLPLMNRGAEGPSMCISSQVGCAVRCTFCATGQNGLIRNLTVDEIAAQVHGILADIGPLPKAFDVSFMGMGEPLHNLTAVAATIETLHAAYSDRSDLHFSLSTVGVPHKLYELATIDTPISLQISLHGVTDDARSLLMPTKSCAPISDVLTAARHYADAKNDVVNINYMLFDGLNDSAECAAKLADLIGGDQRLRLKLSHHNPIAGSDLNPTSHKKKEHFLQLCREHGLQMFSWESMGLDVSGGCGQLRSSVGSDTPDQPGERRP
jgi:23S rRNA (adenine2503-C2)-methyltransferase